MSLRRLASMLALMTLLAAGGAFAQTSMGGVSGSVSDSTNAMVPGATVTLTNQGTGVSVTRRGDSIVLNMPSNITFATDQDQVIPPFYQTLDSVAIVLNKFNRTLIDINGHTDSTGSAGYNQGLSERRAASVANYLGARGVDQRRISTLGFGPSQPIASNATPDGRAQNRRVEVLISPLKG